MTRFTFDITDEQRAVLEAYRSACGHRSLAAALQALIEGTAKPARMMSVEEAKATYRHVEVKASMGAPVQLGPAPSTPGSRLKAKPARAR